MAWTAASFKAAKPEFRDTDDELVDTALVDAASYCSQAVFGDAYDQAIGLYAAHLLSIASSGQQARLKSDATKTTYLVQWKRLVRAVVPSAQTIGQPS